MAVTSFGVGALQSVAQYKAAADQAKQQSDFQNRQYVETADNAVTAYRRGINQLLIREDQETEAAFQEARAAALETASQKASTRNAMVAAGLSGNSAQDVFNEYDRVEADNQLVIDTNLRMTRSQLREQMAGLRADAQSRISAAAPQPVNRPSRFAALLNVGASGLAAANVYRQWDNP